MRKWLVLLLALLGTVGCDDPTVHEYITTNFVCVYMPSWMGECDSSELTARAQNVLDHGLVQAQMVCEDEYNAFKSGTGPYVKAPFKYTVDLLQDGSCFTKLSIAPSTFPTLGPTRLDYLTRHEASDTGCMQGVSGMSVKYTNEGQLVIHSSELSFGSPTCPASTSCETPDTELDIESVCTGFNLEAFGVE